MTKGSKEILRNAGVGLVSGIPYVGGPLGYFLDKAIPSEVEKQYNSFVQLLSQDIEKLHICINEKMLSSAEFISLFNKTLSCAVCEIMNEKRTMLRNIILSALSDQSRFNYYEFYEHLVEKLTFDEVKWLYIVTNMKSENGKSITSSLCKLFPGEDNSLGLHVTTKLLRFGLLQNGECSALGKDFLQYINSPISIFPETPNRERILLLS